MPHCLNTPQHLLKCQSSYYGKPNLLCSELHSIQTNVFYSSLILQSDTPTQICFEPDFHVDVHLQFIWIRCGGQSFQQNDTVRVTN